MLAIKGLRTYNGPRSVTRAQCLQKMADSNQPVVIDNGTGVLKAGFAGGERPKVVISTAVGRPKHMRMMPGGALEGAEIFVGNKVKAHRGALKLSWPMEHGIVVNWHDMEKLWQYVYSRDQLNIPAEEHPVLLTEAPLNPLYNHEKAAETLFETFNIPALFIAPQAILSLYASGRTTGVVLDSGDGVSHVVPVYEGFALPHAISRNDIAGRDVTEQLQLLLRRSGHNLITSSEKELVRQIKEEKCYVAYNPKREEEHQPPPDVYRLPDGADLQLGPERFRAPEILFRPELIGSEERGVQDCLLRSIMRADLEIRKTFFQNIVLAGGSTMFPGYGDRLLGEMRKLAPRDVKIRISAPPERRNSTWIGGSILASLATFRTMWISRADYHEHGVSLVRRRTL